MLYNKNNVRKTNDKKILHKVGKQWKVVSVALLMALGGGAAVAATNTANANADANNGVSQETQATVNSLEQGPQIGQSSAPASASSKASSASSAAPVMPQLSLNPDPSLNGNNASAEYARVKQGYDHAVVGYYGKLVNSYVNFVNSNYSASASSVNSNFASASNKQSNDSSSASSFAAVASGKDWMNEVNNIASAKSGVTGSEFIDAVQNTTSSYSKDVSGSASVVSAANSVVSAAQLVSEVMGNPAVRNTYRGKAIQANFASTFASKEYQDASNAYNRTVNDSMANQTAYYNASEASLVNSIADYYALSDDSLDTSQTSSLANAKYNKNYASASSAVASMAVQFHNTGAFENNNVNGDNGNLNALSEAADNADAKYNAISALANNAQTSVDATRNALSNSANDKNKADMANKVSDTLNALGNTAAKRQAAEQTIAENYANKTVNDAITDASNMFGFTPAETQMLLKKANKLSKATNMNKVPSVTVNGDGSVTVPGITTIKVNDKLTNAKNAANDDTQTINAAKNANFTVSNNGKSQTFNVYDIATQLNNAFSAKNAADNAYNDAKNASSNLGDLYTLVSDTAVEQNYGSIKSSADSVMNSAKTASASYAGAATSDSEAMNSTSAKMASASSAAKAADVLADPNLNLSDVKEMVPASAAAFLGYSYKSNNVTTSTVTQFLDNAGQNSNSVSSAVSGVASLANDAGSQYTSVSSASNSYAKSTDANFVLASYYASSYSAMSSSDATEYNNASAARDKFYNAYAGPDFASDESQLTSAKADEPNQGALANGYARYVQIHEPHVVTVTKQLVLHRNPNYDDKTDTPADAKLAVINKGTHLLVQNVGFDKHGNTRLYVDYKGTKGFITGLRNYVTDSYLIPGQKYTVVFNRTVHQYKGLQFNKSNATKLTVTPKDSVTGTAVLNDDPHYWNGLTRLQLTNGNFVTTLDSMIQSATPVNNNGQTESKGAYFWNGQDNIFKK